MPNLHIQYQQIKKRLESAIIVKFGALLCLGGSFCCAQENDYTKKELHLSPDDLPNLVQIIKKHCSPSNSLAPHVAFIVDGKNPSVPNIGRNLQSYLNLQNSLPIIVSLHENEEQNKQFLNSLIRSLIDKCQNLLIQSNVYKEPLYFTANNSSAVKVIEFLKSESKISEKQAGLSVWTVNTSLGNHDAYHSYKNEQISFESILTYYKSEIDSWSIVDEKKYSGHLIVKTLAKGSSQKHQTTYRIIVQATTELRVMIIKTIKQIKPYFRISGASDIWSWIKPNDDGSLHINEITLKLLRIQSIWEAINGSKLEGSTNRGLIFFAGLEKLKYIDPLIWETAFAMTYLETVLDEYKSEWQYTYKYANDWISNQLGNEEYKELLYFACGEYLIEKGLIIYNDQKEQVYKYVVDHPSTRNKIIEELRESFKIDKGFNELVNSLSIYGNIDSHELVFGSFKIPLTDKDVDFLKKFTDILNLRHYKRSVWITSLIIVYFEEVLGIEYNPEWKAAYDQANIWVDQQVPNNYKNSLKEACNNYLMKEGYYYLTSNCHN
ncbi:14667_t:CDS:2 [Funneliformis mosseae]|uniref:14667_t:CDS:1 n=1 Tax=Funneliformis mosseae TaxID=27381 RepID=A0A9N9GUW0_FUNMO|nr:14667_t:CDS:2 [Funneliformis mosseae]